MSILKDSKKNILIGVDSKGLYVLNSNYSLIKHYKPQNGNYWVPNTIISILEDSDNNIWIGSYSQGIGKFDINTGTYQPIQGVEMKVYSAWLKTTIRNCTSVHMAPECAFTT